MIEKKKPVKKKIQWEIMFDGPIEENSKEMVQPFLDVPPNSHGIIYFNSPGGNAFTAYSIAALIRLRNLNCIGIVLGDCSSAAIIIFAVCKKRFIVEGSSMLFHAMKWESGEMEITSGKNWIKIFEQLENAADQFVADGFGISVETLKTWDTPEKTYFGQEIVELGIAKMLDIKKPIISQLKDIRW